MKVMTVVLELLVSNPEQEQELLSRLVTFWKSHNGGCSLGRFIYTSVKNSPFFDAENAQKIMWGNFGDQESTVVDIKLTSIGNPGTPHWRGISTFYLLVLTSIEKLLFILKNKPSQRVIIASVMWKYLAYKTEWIINLRQKSFMRSTPVKARLFFRSTNWVILSVASLPRLPIRCQCYKTFFRATYTAIGVLP